MFERNIVIKAEVKPNLHIKSKIVTISSLDEKVSRGTTPTKVIPNPY